MISIIIPAYNEADVIERCLKALTDRPVQGGVEIVVACNGCKDNTSLVEACRMRAWIRLASPSMLMAP